MYNVSRFNEKCFVLWKFKLEKEYWQQQHACHPSARRMKFLVPSRSHLPHLQRTFATQQSTASQSHRPIPLSAHTFVIHTNLNAPSTFQLIFTILKWIVFALPCKTDPPPTPSLSLSSKGNITRAKIAYLYTLKAVKIFRHNRVQSGRQNVRMLFTSSKV